MLYNSCINEKTATIIIFQLRMTELSFIHIILLVVLKSIQKENANLSIPLQLYLLLYFFIM